jgi:DNA-binding transcriptional ArsR family regulator
MPDAQAEKAVRDLEIEMALIGRVMDGDKAGPVLPPRLPPSRFSSQRHKLIWAAILDLHRKGLPYDLASVVSALRDRGELDQIGGPASVAMLQGRAGPVASFPHYLSLIGRRAAQRAFGGVGKGLTDLALTTDDRPEASVKARYHSLIRRADALCDFASRNGHQPTMVKDLYVLATEPQEPVRWVYQPWLCPGDIVILAGESGLGKSWVALDLMLALILGGPFAAQKNQAGPQKVLYVDEENNERLIKYRLRKLIDGLDIGLGALDPALVCAKYAYSNNFCVDDEASLAALKKQCEQLRPDWILIDSLIRIHRRDENSNSEMSALISGILSPLARASGAGMIIIHHLGKSTKDRPTENIGDRLRGASSLRGAVDQLWGLERADDNLRLRHIKGRMGEASPVMVELEDTHLGNGLRVKCSDIQQAVNEIIRDTLAALSAGGCERGRLQAQMEEAGYTGGARTLSKALGKMYGDGVVRKRREGQKMRYWLTEHAPSDAE